MRAILTLFTFLMLGLAVPLAAGAASVTIDGTEVQNVVDRSHHLLIPFRAPMEQLGATVQWANPTATASINGGELMKVNIGDVNGTIQGNPHQMSVAPELIEGLAYIPVEVLGDISRATVVYSNDRTSATVTNFDLAGVEAIGSAGAQSGLDAPWLWVFLLPISGAVAAFACISVSRRLQVTTPRPAARRAP